MVCPARAATGENVRKRDDLTDQERQIARLTRNGLSSPEIAPGSPSARAVLSGRLNGHASVLLRPKLRVLKMPRPPLACAFAPSLPTVSGYFFSARGMAAPMRSKASFWRLVGVVRTGTAAGVPGKRSSLRVRVPRWFRSPW